MPMIQLFNQKTPARSSDQNQSDLVNMYLEEEQSVNKDTIEYKITAYPTFGLTLFADTGQGNVRALIEQAGITYAVAGNGLYQINSDGTNSLLGALNTSSGFSKMISITGASDTNNQIVAIDGTNGYYYNIGSSTGQFPITDVNFPQNCIDALAHDDYGLFANFDSMRVNYSSVSDLSTYDSLDFFSKYKKSDKIQGLWAFKGDVFVPGTKTTEIYDTDTTGQASFNRRNDIFLEFGLAATQGWAIAGNNLYFLAQSRTGGYGIMNIDWSSMFPKNVATKPIMTLLNSFSTVSDCIAYAYSKDGHEFIDFTFPTGNSTITFDTATGLFITRTSNINGTYGRFLGNCHCFCYGKSLIGDFNSGKIYYQDDKNYTENGVPIKRQIVTPSLQKDGKRLYVGQLEITCQTNVGSNKTFLLEYSRDKGQVWETVGTYTLPTSNLQNILTSSLGSAFTYTFRITTTDNFNLSVLGFQVKLQVGTD